MITQNPTGKNVFALCALLLLAWPAFSQAEEDFDSVYIFGDSLSDAGNFYLLTGQVSMPPYLPVPSAPYDIGGHHFSNGKTWAEHFAKEIEGKKGKKSKKSKKSTHGGKPSLQNPGKNGNYAFGGARARSNSGIGAPDSTTQIAMYQGDFGLAEADALYVMQFGGNDLRDALVAAETDPAAAVGIIQSAIGDLAIGIQSLYFAGARSFLVANAPNLAHAPAVKLAGASGVAGFFTGIYNGGLEGGLQQLELALPGISIYRLDMAGFTDDVVSNPGKYKLSITDTPCLSFFITMDTVCDRPEDYLFWDGLHPTTAAHKQLAKYAVQAIESAADEDDNQ